MKIRPVLFILIFVFPLISNAQVYYEDEIAIQKRDTNTYKPHQLIVKYNLLSHWDLFTPSFQVAVEHGINKKLSMQHELGYITQYALPFDQSLSGGRDLWGVRYRLELRAYMIMRPHASMYLAPEFMYKYVVDKTPKPYARYDGAYTQMLPGPVLSHIGAVHFKMGFQFYAGKLCYDVYVGTGLRMKYLDYSSLPDDAWIIENNWFMMDAVEFPVPSAIAGFKIGYVIK